MVTDEEKKYDLSGVLKRVVLCSRTSSYLIVDFTGEGAFGKVAKGVNLLTSQILALEIL